MESSNEQHSLLKGTLIYAAGNFGTRILTFLLVPLYTYYISTAENGYYENLITAGSLLLPLMTFQIADAAYAFLLSGKEEKNTVIRAAWQTVLLGSLASVILILGVFFVFHLKLGWILAVYVCMQAFFTVGQKLVRGLGNQKLFALSGILYTAVFLILNVVQIVFLHGGIQSLLLSSCIGSAAALVFLFWREPSLAVSPFQKTPKGVFRTLLTFSAPLIPNQINWWVMNSSDRLVITFFLGLASNGIYAVTCKFPAFLQSVLDFFNTSFTDLTVSGQNSKSGSSGIFLGYYRFCFSLLVWLIPATQIFISLVMAPEYRSAGSYVGFLYMGTVFQAFSSFYGVGYLAGGKTGQAGATSIYGAVINLVTSLLMIRVLGLQAASISTLLGFAGMWLVRERQNRTRLGIRIPWLSFLGWTLLDLLIVVFCFYAGMWAKMTLVLLGILCFLYANRTLMGSVIRQLGNRIRPRTKV